jgi:adhesin transport system membrane fusion protein
MKNIEGEAPSRRRRASALLDRSVLLDEREGPPLVRGALLFGSIVVALFVLWSAFADLEEIELASGEIVPADDTIKVQHPTGGMVVAILVEEGKLVRAGDTIMRIDATDSESQRIQLRSQLYALKAQRSRLIAQTAGRAPDFSSLPPEASIFVEDQRALFNASQAQASLSLEILESQEGQARMEIERVAGRRKALGRQVALAEEDAAISRELVDQGMAARPELLAKLKVFEGLIEENESLAAEADKAEERLGEISSRIREFRASQIKQGKSELASVNERIAQAETSLSRLETSAGRLELQAPVTGMVHAINYRSPGSVIPPGAVIMELIPTGKMPNAQIRINPSGIGTVNVGHPTRLKISAYPYDRYGAFKGTLNSISPTTFIGGDGKPYYRGIVRIDGRELEHAETLDLVPGMTLSAELLIGKKTLLQYLLKPIFASAREAFREK